MKRLILLLIITATYFAGYTQSNPEITASYTYTNYKLNINSKVKLLINGSESLSIFQKHDSTTNSSTSVDDDGAIKLNKRGDDKIGRQVYKNLKTQHLIFRDFYANDGDFFPCVVEEPLPDFKWTLNAEEKQIGKFLCKSASATFRGRTYTVWYNPEIPIVHGPWKFHGLPGLIVEVNSADNNIVFRLNTVKQSTEAIEIKAPDNGEKITLEEYVEYKDNVIDDYIKKLYSTLPRGSRITVNSTGEDYNLEKSFK